MKLASFSLKSSKETLTSNSGLILFGEFCQKIGLSKEVRYYLVLSRLLNSLGKTNILSANSGGKNVSNFVKTAAPFQGILLVA